jgi:hypothetical protein
MLKHKQFFLIKIMDKFRKLPVYRITPLESDFTEIAITDDPAIEEYFLKFNAEEIKIQFNNDKKIITGPVMIPNKLIYRNDSIGERFVVYDEEGIRAAASAFFKNGLKFNSDHTNNILPIEILESYFASEGNTYNVPVGSWIVSARVNDLELWNKLKENKMGFSFQSLFSNELIGTKLINFNKNENEKMDLKEKLQAAINAVLFGESPKESAQEASKEAQVTVEMSAKKQVPAEVPAEEPINETPAAADENAEPDDSSEPMTEDEIQAMIDASIMTATESILKACKEMIDNSLGETNTAMSAMSKKLEEFSKQTLSQPITETVINTAKLNSNSDYSYLSGIKNKK